MPLGARFVTAFVECHDVPVLAVRGSDVTWRRVGLIVFVVAGFLLLSMGGAIVAAPVTVPLMFVSSRRHPTRPFRITGAALSSLTVAEVAWACWYVARVEEPPWIWFVPLTAAVGTALLFAAKTKPTHQVAIAA
jgi:hypothetical protein